MARLLVLMFAVSLLGAAPGFPKSAFPQIGCLYYIAFDRIWQFWVTDAYAYHLAPADESKLPRMVDPQQLLQFHTHDPTNHCDVLFNADAIDYPLTMSQVMTYHYHHLAYELQHKPVPAAP